MKDELVGRHNFVFNEDANGGESLVLSTEFYHDPHMKDVYMRQILILNSYNNSVNFNLGYNASFTPQTLRKLADELEQEQLKADNSIN